MKYLDFGYDSFESKYCTVALYVKDTVDAPIAESLMASVDAVVWGKRRDAWLAHYLEWDCPNPDSLTANLDNKLLVRGITASGTVVNLTIPCAPANFGDVDFSTPGAPGQVLASALLGHWTDSEGNLVTAITRLAIYTGNETNIYLMDIRNALGGQDLGNDQLTLIRSIRKALGAPGPDADQQGELAMIAVALG